MTVQLKRFLVDLSRITTIQDAAEWTGLSWDTVKDAVKEQLQRDYARIRLKELKRLAIDELYLGRRKKYITLVTDYDSGRIVWVGRGRGQEALQGFWRRLKASGARVEAVAMDMSHAYAAAVAQKLPGALVVFDRFHVVKKMNEALDELRRELVRQAESPDERLAIKGTRWLLLYRRDRLDAEQHTRLEEVLRANAPLACAYILKEELNLLWEQPDRLAGIGFLRRWCVKALQSSLLPLRALVKTLLRHAKGILSYFSTGGMTNARMEGINRKIRALLSQVYGFRDDDFLTLKLYSLHEAKHKLVG